MPRTPGSHLSQAPKLAGVSSPSTSTIAVGDRYWAFVAARAVPAALVAIFITFSADHSVRVGWVALVVFGVATGVIVAVGSSWMLRGAPKTLLTIQGVALVLVGLVSVVGAAALPLTAYTAALAAGFVVAGVLELVAGLRARGLTPVARDWIFLGAASIVFGLAVLLVPTDLSQTITVPGKVLPDLTAAVVVVGMLGAYAAIVAVYAAIAGLSIKWARNPDAVVNVESAS